MGKLLITRVAYNLNSKLEHRCYSCPSEFDGMYTNYKKIIAHSDDMLLGYIQEGQWIYAKRVEFDISFGSFIIMLKLEISNEMCEAKFHTNTM